MEYFPSKTQQYDHLIEALEALIADERDPIANAANVAALIYNTLPELNWAGFYFRRGDELVLGPFQGQPACVRIEFGRGVCGTSAARGEPLVVGNVHRFDGHIACDAASNSELVIPLLHEGQVLGVIDFDSPLLDRFDETDQQGMERVATIWLERSQLDELRSTPA